MAYQQTLNSQQQDTNISRVMLVTGGVLAVAAVVTYVAWPRVKKKEGSAWVAPSLGGVVVGGEFRTANVTWGPRSGTSVPRGPMRRRRWLSLGCAGLGLAGAIALAACGANAVGLCELDECVAQDAGGTPPDGSSPMSGTMDEGSVGADGE